MAFMGMSRVYQDNFTDARSMPSTLGVIDPATAGDDVLL